MTTADRVWSAGSTGITASHHSRSVSMKGDGDILGVRRRNELNEEDEGASATRGAVATLLGGGDGVAAVAGRAPGSSPLKRQRSGVRGAGAEIEETVDGPAGDIPVDQLTPDQLRRYQAWKRSRLEPSTIREFMMDRASETLRQNLIHGQGVGSLRETSVIAVASMAKMFVGDLIEKAKIAQMARGEEGPLRPMDLLQAREKLHGENQAPQLLAPTRRARGFIASGSGRRMLGGGANLVKGNVL